MEPREPGGLEIAATKKLEQKATLGIVPSQTGTGKYVVDRSASNPTSSCPDFEQWLAPSKHVCAVEFVLRRETSAPNGTVTETVRVTYRQEWSAYNAAQVHEKERVAVLLHDLCAGIDNPPQGRGRPRLPISDSIFCAVVKVYSGSSGRRAMTDLRDLAAKGYIERAPHYNSVFNALENPELTLFLHALIERSAMPLAVLETDFAVDASGFSTGDYMRWYSAKCGKQMVREIAQGANSIGTRTNIVTAVEVTDCDTHDIHMFRPLLEKSVRRFTVKRVTADKAYSSARIFGLADQHGAEAYVPLKKNATGLRPDKWTAPRVRNLGARA